MSETAGFISETAIRVRYAETDAMGVVHHSSYVVWLECGRSDWMREVGPSYAELERQGLALPVTELSLRYLAPLRYDDLATIRTWVDGLKSRQVRFAYEVRDARGTLCATAQSTHLCTSADGRVIALPNELRARLADAVGRADLIARGR